MEVGGFHQGRSGVETEQMELLRHLQHQHHPHGVTSPTDGRTAGPTQTKPTEIHHKQTTADQSESSLASLEQNASGSAGGATNADHLRR